MAFKFNPITGQLDLVGGVSSTGTTTVGNLIDNGLTPNTAVAADGSKQLVSSTTSLTELSYVTGVTSAIQTQLNSKIPLTQKAAANGVATLDANTLIPVNQIPPAALERLVIVANQAARFALTTATVQNGDTVKQTDTNVMYFVIDDTNLGNSSGYAVYSAGTAVNFSGTLAGDVTGIQSATVNTKASDSFFIYNSGDNTKQFGWDLSSETTGTKATIKPLITQNQTYQIQPNVDATANLITQNATSGQIFIGANATIGGSNSGIQYSDATTANRGQIKLGSYVNATSVAGVSTLTSRSGTVGTNAAVVAGQDYSKWTAQAGATTPGSAPISGTFAFKANTVNSLTVTTDYHIQLTNLAGTLGDRLYLGSEGALKLPNYTTGIAHFDSSGNVTSSNIDLTSDVTGTLPVANGGTGTTTSTGTGSVVLSNSPTLVTPALGTPSAIVLTNATGLPLTTGITGVLPIANGGTNNSSALTAGSVIFSDGTKLTQDNARFFWDDTNFRLGINTSSPSTAAIDVRPSTDATGGSVKFTSADGSKSLSMGTTNAGTFRIVNQISGSHTILAITGSQDALVWGQGAQSAFMSIKSAASTPTTFPTMTLEQATSQTGNALDIYDNVGPTKNASITHAGLATFSNIIDNGLTANTAVVANGSKQLASSATTSTELGFVSGVTSAIQTQLNGKQATGNYITDLTGDATASGPGSAALTLATVNGNVGSFGSSTSIPSFTVNAKGLITAASGNAVIAPAGTLSGTTLNSTVVSSSLTSVGTITSGIWNGTTIAVANGGTGDTSFTANQVILGGTTSTGALQQVAAGTSGQVLTSNGASAPTWTTVTAPVASAGDINETTFTAADNQVAAANVTGLAFANGTVRSADILLSIVRAATYAQYKINVVQGASSWYINQSYVGDATGLTFTITSAGQVQYTSTSTGSTANLHFRAITLSV